jgi:hypothetical protein
VVLRETDGGASGVHQSALSESGLDYQGPLLGLSPSSDPPPPLPPSLPPLLALGWDAILKYENGTTAPSADDPLVIKPTAMSDAQMMGAVPSPSPDTSVESAQNAQRRVSYRDALANGMWRVRTAPLAFYIGDSAGTVSRLF